MADVMEMARFGVVEGADVAAAAAAVDGWLAAQPGFVSRVLVGPDDHGLYTDLVRWRSAADAHAAMAASQTAPELGAFMEIIDPSTLDMRHAAVVLGR